MPRQSSRPSASAPQRAAPAPSHGRAAPAPAATQAPPPAQHAPAPAPAAAAPAAAPAAGGGMMSGLMGSMMSGMATGTGMAVANRAVDAVMGPRQTEVVHRHEGAPVAAASPSCQFQQDQLEQCMKSSSNAASCQSFMDALKACQQGQ
ncbi:SLC4A4 [Symbiodinium necroappetens]|uniref:SLC4A4 protein n=1 Tax=Symbiodinium necroappetens TaxID=1628268 RepID=A0A812L747_9DINO|nr:SLC4A4 [Symbiodinium necroappetens]|eukprot:CAMPEP_0181425798 /NCGR_PEP_ID=MMETSP1110-20121109/15341_1 /TAXON_ID=174948 /ORGANISM="Symbiodinium sp., Strain CCMP421" /LENGTH=147 /DNA_ID=CAMNT_0023548989 /DNA_START=71 /DNA_END=514 /DNA_ORIENTATION=-